MNRDEQRMALKLTELRGWEYAEYAGLNPAPQDPATKADHDNDDAQENDDE